MDEERRAQAETRKHLKTKLYRTRHLRYQANLEEGLVNAIKHGNQMDRLQESEDLYEISRTLLKIHINDEGAV